jgi:CheY-like chemotaxis protein
MAGRRVLIVDDDPMVRRLVRDYLEIAEYEVSEAVDGSDGQIKAEAQHPDIILLDLVMPGVDGYEVCRALKLNPKTRDIPVIIATASGDVKLNHLAYAAGALACITKPFRREALEAIVGVTLAQADRHRSAGAN